MRVPRLFRAANLTTVLSLIALLFTMAPVNAAPPVFNGDLVSSTTPTFNVKAYGAKGDGTTDDTSAFINAITAAENAGGGIVFVPCSSTPYVIAGALAIPYTGGSSTSAPVQQPIRITGCGAAWDSPLNGVVTTLKGSVLNLTYNGGDGLHPAKIDTRGAGYLEIDHLTLEDTGGDNFIFGQTTNTAVYIHDNAIIGNTANSGTTVSQDFFRLGGQGYWASSVSTTNGSKTLTIGGGDPPFTASMVGWVIGYSVAGNLDTGTNPQYYSTISAVNSSTSVTLADTATATISGGEANYFGVGTDPKAPFEGYTSKFSHNLYSHIRRAAILGNYANGNVFEDELFAYSDGCSNNSLTGCAPYYFDKSSGNRLGNIIRGPQGEAQNYPYWVSIANDAVGNVFSDLSPDDMNTTTLGGVYTGSASVKQNRFSLGSWATPYTNQQIDTTIATGFASGSQTVTPASMSGITTSTPVLVDPDGTNPEWVTPSATTGSTFTATFLYSHGNNIRVLGATPFIVGPGRLLNAYQSTGQTHESNIEPGITLTNGNLPNANVGINADGSNGLYFNIPTGSVGGYRWLVQGGASVPMSLTTGGYLTVLGNGQIAGLILTNGNPFVGGSNVAVGNDGSGTNGMYFNVPTGSTNGWRWWVNSGASQPMQLTAAGALSVLSSVSAASGSATSCTGGYKFTNGIMVITGAGAPTCTAPAGSEYLRSDGATGTRLYISAGSGTWNAVAGV